MKLSDLDIINPLDGWFGQLTHDPMHRFTFHSESAICGAEIEQLMRQYGIRIWGRTMSHEDDRSFLVKETQAEWAEYLLCRAGVPLICPLINPENARYAQQAVEGSMPTPWTSEGVSAHSLVDHVVDWIARFTS